MIRVAACPQAGFDGQNSLADGAHYPFSQALLASALETNRMSSSRKQNPILALGMLAQYSSLLEVALSIGSLQKELVSLRSGVALTYNQIDIKCSAQPGSDASDNTAQSTNHDAKLQIERKRI
jgi:hypothetical protein